MFFKYYFRLTSGIILLFYKSMVGSTTANSSSMNYSLPDIGKLGVRGEESLY
ncbi:hypothetical protein NSP_24870 [Nodularia spumigena CCY9414]|nr:hypothetical protein NSP_24870 [Nodularia spumigena CCY9414]